METGCQVQLEHIGEPLDSTMEAYLRPHWYALYTCANHERRVAQQLASRGIDHFLPQYEAVHKWKDRKVKVQMALFPGYVFVHVALKNRLRVLQVPGAAYLVSFAGRPVAVPAVEFVKIRDFLNRGFGAEPHPYLTVGRSVRVKSGPLEGLVGIIVRQRNRSRFVVSLELIQRSMAVDVSAVDLESVCATPVSSAALSAPGSPETRP